MKAQTVAHSELARPVANDSATPITVCPWKNDKRWVYSITFDEALADLHKFAIPILEEHGVPGHLEVVVGQMGQVRNIGASSYNGYRHMDAVELREMLRRGWGVGNHSWTHAAIDAKTADLNLRQAKEVLEEAIGEPVTVYCSPGDNRNLNQEVIDLLPSFGYLAGMSLTDALNRPDDEDLLWLNRTFLHMQGYAPFFSEFDPFRNLQYARRDQGWVIDYLHCPFEKPVHKNKDCSAAQLRERIETVVSEGGSEVWLARVEDAIDYRYVRRHAAIEPIGKDLYSIRTQGLPAAVSRRSLTLSVPAEVVGVAIDGKSQPLMRRGDGRIFQIDLSQPRQVKLQFQRELQ